MGHLVQMIHVHLVLQLVLHLRLVLQVLSDLECQLHLFHQFYQEIQHLLVALEDLVLHSDQLVLVFLIVLTLLVGQLVQEAQIDLSDQVSLVVQRLRHLPVVLIALVNL